MSFPNTNGENTNKGERQQLVISNPQDSELESQTHQY